MVEEEVQSIIVFFILLFILLLVITEIIQYSSAYEASSTASNLKQIENQNMQFYITNNTLYIVNKGGPITIGKLEIIGTLANNINYTEFVSLPLLQTGITTEPLHNQTLFAKLVLLSQSNFYIKTIYTKNINLFRINNMFSSSYVYINGKMTEPAFQNLSTYYYFKTAQTNIILLLSQYFYKSITTTNSSISLPTTMNNYKITFSLLNGKTEVQNNNTIFYTINKKYHSTVINSNSVIIPYSGNKIDISYCYISCTSGAFSTGNYSGPISNMTLPLYKQTSVNFYITAKNQVYIGGIVKLYGSIKNYSFAIVPNGTKETIINGNYIADYVTFNNYVNQSNIQINNTVSTVNLVAQ